MSTSPHGRLYGNLLKSGGASLGSHSKDFKILGSILGYHIVLMPF